MHKTQVLFAAVLFFSTAAFSFEVKSHFSHIYSDSDGSANLFNISASDEFGQENKKIFFDYKLDYNKLKSTHQEINGQVNNVNFSASIKNPIINFTGRFGVFDSGEINLDLSSKISNDGMQGNYFGFESLFNLYDLQIKPFYYYSNTGFSDGDMAYFMGYPSECVAMIFGSDFIYDKNFFQLIYIPLSFNILTNDSKEELFNSKNFATGLLYSRECSVYAGELKFNFNPFAAYYYAKGNTNGILTRESQPYMYFVFDYFKVDADYKLHSILIGSNANLTYKSLKVNFDSALAFIPYESMDINTSWKKLDGLAPWQETLVWNSLEMEKEDSTNIGFDGVDKSGLFIFNLGASYSFLQNHGELSVNKKIIIPFSLRKSSGADSNSSGPKVDADTIKNILLSGISIGLSVRF